MFLSVVVKYLKLTLISTKLHIMASMEYKIDFFLQVFGVFIYDLSTSLIWVIFFKQFPEINGWNFQDSAFVLGISWISFFLISCFFFGVTDLSEMISTGKLDQYMLTPKSILWQVSTSRSFYQDFGVFILGLFLLTISGYITLTRMPLLIFLILTIALINFNFTVIINSGAFYFGNFEYATDKLFRTFADLIYFPQNVFSGFLKFLMITLIPAFFVGTVPLELIKEFKILIFVGLTLFAILQTIIALKIFNNGLKRYESGNLINIKST